MDHGDEISEVRIAGAILGRLLPPLDLAADELYARVDAGERIDGRRIPASLGFQTGVLDNVLIEAFTACVPAVKLFLTAGGLALITEWIRHRNGVADDARLQRRMQELEQRTRDREPLRTALDGVVDTVVQRAIAADRSAAKAKVFQVIVQVPELTDTSEEDDNV